MTRSDISVFPNPEKLSRAAAEMIVGLAGASISARGVFNLVLSGGSSPAGLYRIMGDDWSGLGLDWGRIRLFWGDERLVPYSDLRSNFGTARRLFIDRAPLAGRNVFPMPVHLAPDRATLAYSRTLAQAFNLESTRGAPPVFDLILLGLGPDGHSASLFPGRPALEEKQAWVVAETKPGLEPKTPRLSLTLSVINRARRILFMAHGPGKASVIKLVLDQGADNSRILPAARVTGRTSWYLDADAAELIGG